MTHAPARRRRLLQRRLALLFASLVAAFSVAFPAVAQPLPALGVEPEYTVSGLSSGGYMAAQFAVVHSSEVVGLGVFQGGPYDCALGDLGLAVSRCACLTPPCAPPDPSALAAQSARQARLRSAAGLVDPVADLKRQRVWLYSGGLDATVPRQDVEALRIFYRR